LTMLCGFALTKLMKMGDSSFIKTLVEFVGAHSFEVKN